MNQHLPEVRQPKYRMPEPEARELLRRADVVQLASTLPDGTPVLRTLNAVMIDDFILFHGSKAGEKRACLGRPATVLCERVIARVPSYFIDPEMACPATTYYESAIGRGTLEAIDEPELKARMLEQLMHKYQPEGGHKPITHHDPLYRKQVAGISVFGLRLEHVTGKRKLGQNRSAAQLTCVVEGLWRRGAPGDIAAIELLFAHNPELPRPAFLRGPGETTLLTQLDERHADAAVALLQNQYWNLDQSAANIRAALLGSSAWIGACTANGELIGSARAVADGGKFAYIADVIVAEQYRRMGIGSALMRLILDHPQVRRSRTVRLGTADRADFYRQFGFVDLKQITAPFNTTWMLLARSP